MRVCYYNYLIDATTLTATNENSNQPVTNLYHHYLENAFYATADNSVITIIFDQAYDLDYFAFGYHNLDSMSVSFYDESDVLLNTISIDVTEDTNIQYFTMIENVKKVIISCVSLQYYLYIGSIFIGEYLELPRFRQALKSGLDLMDDSFISGGGQASGNRRVVLKPYQVEFSNIDNNDLENIEDYVIYCQTSIPHFVDLYPDNHTKMIPFYGVLNLKKIKEDKRRISDFKWNFNLHYKEVR
jgi:hypothetical protein